MFSKLKYEIKKKDKRTSAKTVEFTNPILDKKHIFPSVMFDVRQKEDLAAVTSLFSKPNKLKRVFGFQVPFYKLAKYMPTLMKNVPRKLSFISDVNSEVFYYGSIKEEKKNFYLSYRLIPERIRSEILAIQKKKGVGTKRAKHLALWDNIVSDNRLLLNLISTYVNTQMSYQLDFISVPAPLILDKNHLAYVETCYNKAVDLYHGDLLDIEEEQGRVLTLYLNIHKNFLKKDTNLNELYAMIGRVNPKAISIKLDNVPDIRKEDAKIKENWTKLMNNLGILSYEGEIPIFYLSTCTEGLISQAYGIDCFTQMLNKSDNIEKEIKGFDKIFAKKMWTYNPQLNSGKIVLYGEKDFVDRPTFEKEIIKKGVLPYPIAELSSFNVQRVLGMNAITFRQFSKRVLMLVRNFEVNENAEAISNSDISTLRNRYKSWFTDFKLFP